MRATPWPVLLPANRWVSLPKTMFWFKTKRGQKSLPIGKRAGTRSFIRWWISSSGMIGALELVRIKFLKGFDWPKENRYGIYRLALRKEFLLRPLAMLFIYAAVCVEEEDIDLWSGAFESINEYFGYERNDLIFITLSSFLKDRVFIVIVIDDDKNGYTCSCKTG